MNLLLEKRRLTFLDGPGSFSYLSEIIKGGFQADAAVARAAGIGEILVVVTKMETIGWS